MTTPTSTQPSYPPKVLARDDWEATRAQFLRAVPAHQRPAVVAVLASSHHGGPGLRMWLRSLAVEDRFLPADFPPELIQVYLDDPEAVPLHDCADCGLAVPVHPGPYSYEEEPLRVYFPTCPHCGGRTGRYAYWSNADHR